MAHAQGPFSGSRSLARFRVLARSGEGEDGDEEEEEDGEDDVFVQYPFFMTDEEVRRCSAAPDNACTCCFSFMSSPIVNIISFKFTYIIW